MKKKKKEKRKENAPIFNQSEKMKIKDEKTKNVATEMREKLNEN